MVEPRGSTPVERVINHALQAALIGAMGWFAISVTDLRTQMAVVQVQLTQMTERLKDFKELVADRYTGVEAQNAHNAINARLHDFELRLRELEKPKP